MICWIFSSFFVVVEFVLNVSDNIFPYDFFTCYQSDICSGENDDEDSRIKELIFNNILLVPCHISGSDRFPLDRCMYEAAHPGRMDSPGVPTCYCMFSYSW